MKDFVEYSDYFAKAADMHRTAYSPFAGLGEEILNLDNRSLAAKQPRKTRLDPARELAMKIQSTHQNIIVNFSKISHLQEAFTELTRYIEDKYNNRSMNDILASNDVQVLRSYAKISEDLDETISDVNILPHDYRY